MALVHDTCHCCGQRWGFSNSEPSPIIDAGCPNCNPKAKLEMQERNRALVAAALDKLLNPGRQPYGGV